MADRPPPAKSAPILIFREADSETLNVIKPKRLTARRGVRKAQTCAETGPPEIAYRRRRLLSRLTVIWKRRQPCASFICPNKTFTGYICRWPHRHAPSVVLNLARCACAAKDRSVRSSSGLVYDRRLRRTDSFDSLPQITHPSRRRATQLQPPVGRVVPVYTALTRTTREKLAPSTRHTHRRCHASEMPAPHSSTAIVGNTILRRCGTAGYWSRGTRRHMPALSRGEFTSTLSQSLTREQIVGLSQYLPDRFEESRPVLLQMLCRHVRPLFAAPTQ